MSETTYETAVVATAADHTTELAPTAAAAEKQYEIQSAIAIAKRFPRNEDQAFERLMRACLRVSFAEDAAYAFPRAGETVEGPSVNLAREAARVWGNVRHGLEVIRDDETTRGIRGWAWDMETNTKISAEDEFKKQVYRKRGGWIAADERDLRELTNRRGAILVRNCILQLLPKDLIEDAVLRSKQTIKEGTERDPETARKRLILAFSALSITPEMLAAKLGHPLAQCSPAEIAELRAVYKSIADGNSKWSDYVGNGSATTTEKSAAPAEPDPLLEKAAAATAAASVPTPITEPPVVQAETPTAAAEELPPIATDAAADAREAELVRAVERLENAIVTAESVAALNAVWKDAQPVLDALAKAEQARLTKLYRQNAAGLKEAR